MFLLKTCYKKISGLISKALNDGEISCDEFSLILSERLGDIDIHREMSKLFKPITEAQRDVKDSLLGELRHIKEKLLAITFTQLQAIAAPPEESEDFDTSGLFIGPVAEQYLRQFASQQEVDKNVWHL